MASYMNPTMGGPHWNVTTGGFVCGTPSRASAPASNPLGGLCQWDSVSQRFLVIPPSNMMLLIVMPGVGVCCAMGRDERDGAPTPPADGRLVTWAVRVICRLSGLKSKRTNPGGPEGSRHRIEAGTRPPDATL